MWVMEGRDLSVAFTNPLVTACSNLILSAGGTLKIRCADRQTADAPKAETDNLFCALQEAEDMDRCAICHHLIRRKYLHASGGARTLAMRPSYGIPSAVSGLGQ